MLYCIIAEVLRKGDPELHGKCHGKYYHIGAPSQHVDSTGSWVFIYCLILHHIVRKVRSCVVTKKDNLPYKLWINLCRQSNVSISYLCRGDKVKAFRLVRFGLTVRSWVYSPEVSSSNSSQYLTLACRV